MANFRLFNLLKATPAPAADTINAAHAPAYVMTPRHQLAQYAATGCLHGTFYASAEMQLDTVLGLCREVDDVFIARTAIYCREHGHMKDLPALLTAVLAARGAAEFPAVFGRVIDNGKMLRTFVQIVRSGVTGRRSFGTRAKKLVQAWLNGAPDAVLLAASVGASPSLADVVRMVHPKPADPTRAALFAWLIDKPYDHASLPSAVQAFEAYKSDQALPVPQVPFQMLTALPLTSQAWAQLARQGGWHMVRMNLNTFARHGVYALPGMADAVAARLRDREAIAQAGVFPYQLMSAYRAAADNVPQSVRGALHDALEISLAKVPAIAGQVVVCPDVSGSMHSPVTGYRGSATSAARCIDVAALVAAALLRKNPSGVVLPFERDVVSCRLDPRDTVMTNATKLASIGGGGTNCSAPLALMNRKRMRADLVVLVSDNESWLGARAGATETMHQWQLFKGRNPRARLVCIDCTPNASSQAVEREDILNIGGFSDSVFDIVAQFAAGELDAAHWVGVIEAIDIAAH
jgi:60 kDa SS-A/Ro ribonucleoprotein